MVGVDRPARQRGPAGGWRSGDQSNAGHGRRHRSPKVRGISSELLESLLTAGYYLRDDAFHIARAKDHLIQALATLTDGGTDAKAAALVLCGMALLEISKSDPQLKAQDKALTYLAAIIKDREVDSSDGNPPATGSDVPEVPR